MPTVTRRFEIDAGHRLLNHVGKCRHVHGHRYIFDITVFASELDEYGCVIDFSEIKRVVGNWFDSNLDHSFITQTGDPLLPVFHEQQLKVFIMDRPPTAENLSQLVYCKMVDFFPKPLKLIRVICWETSNCCAQYP